MLQRERRHVECVQNNDCKREVSTTHDHNCSQPTLRERATAPITSDREVGLHFGLRPPAFDLRPSAFGLRPPALAFGLRPPAFKQSDTVEKSMWHAPAESTSSSAKRETPRETSPGEKQESQEVRERIQG